MSDRDDVAAVNEAFYHAFESADLDTMTDLWIDDEESLCVHPGAMPVRGTKAINRSWALIMANTPYIQFFLTDVEVSVQGDTALVTCTENILSGGPAEPDGSAGPLVGGLVVATNVFRRTPDGWKIWSHHGSPVLVEREDEPGGPGPAEESGDAQESGDGA